MVNGTSAGYVWDLAEGMPAILQDGSTRYLTGPGGLPIEQVDGSGTIQYYIQDQLGSTRGLLDASGTVVGSSAFTPYGEVKGHSGASTPFAHAGQYTDSESGLQYLRARYYDPSTAQFLTVDPLLSSTMEPYGYAGGNGLNASDPSGMCIFGLPCPSPVRSALIWGFQSAANFIGTTHDQLTSGQPLCVGFGVGSVYINVLMLGLGPEAKAGESLVVAGAESAAKGLADEALVVRGGLNTAERFRKGSGVTIDVRGLLHGVSVNSAPERSIEELSRGIPNGQIDVTTVGRIRQVGGDVKPDEIFNPRNPYHCLMSGITPHQAESLFTPTINNPSRCP